MYNAYSFLYIHSFTCKCGAFPASDEDKEELRALNLAYQKGLRDLVDSGRYDTKDDFTVVTQPFWSETELPRTVSLLTFLML